MIRLPDQIVTKPVGVCVVLVNDSNQVLLGKRKNSYKSGWYGLPGGCLEFGETCETAAKRELAEETGVAIHQLRLIGVVREDQADCIFTLSFFRL